jgi:hypothetical protein
MCVNYLRVEEDWEADPILLRMDFCGVMEGEDSAGGGGDSTVKPSPVSQAPSKVME